MLFGKQHGGAVPTLRLRFIKRAEQERKMKVGFIGCGNMGGALARAVISVMQTNVYVNDYDKEKAEAFCRDTGAEYRSGADICRECDFIFLGVKPAVLPSLLTALDSHIQGNKRSTLVSMAAGVAISKIEAALTSPHAIIRIMPNTPVAIGKGMITWCNNDLVTEKAQDEFLKIMSGTGSLDRISEGLIDAASAVAGCGPAFVYMFLEALADGGVECGLPRDKAMLYAAETLKGAADMVEQTGKHPGLLKDEVCSPGGSTIEGVRALEEGAFRATAAGAVIAAFEKTKKLG